jgi:hypothetical protein
MAALGPGELARLARARTCDLTTHG